MNLIPNNLGEVSCAILNGKTFIVGISPISKLSQNIILADDVTVIESQSIIPIIISKIKPLTIIKTKTHVYKGTLINQTDKVATIELGNGRILTTEYDLIESQPFPSHQLQLNGKNYEKKNIRLQIAYNNGLDYEVISHVAKLDNFSITIWQQIKLTNNLPFDLTDLKNLLVSFQKTNHIGVKMIQMQSISRTQSTVEEISAPIDLGPIKLLPAKSTINVSGSKPIILDIINTYVEIDLDVAKLNSTLELSPKNHVLYPSTIYINDSISKLPMASFDVPLQLPGSVFFANLGITTSVSVRKKIVDKTSYLITLSSNVDHPILIRISGYQLHGRKDIYILPPHEMHTFKGVIPIDTQ